MTPRELFLEFTAGRRRLEADLERDKRTAWMTAYLHRVKKMPALMSWLSRRGEAPKQTAQQMKTMLTIMHGTYGGQMTTRGDREMA